MLHDPRLDQQIPAAEEDNLLFTFAEAMELADASDVAGGQELIEAGRSRAEDLRDQGEEWGDLLVDRYLDALDRYRERYSGSGQP